MFGNTQGSERRIVLVGTTGTGKSATANTVLGRPVFESKMSFVSVTQCCQREEALLNGRKVVVVDTPGFFDTTCSEWKTSAEVRKCVKFCTPGPHVILQVIRLGRFTREEKEVAGLIKEIFSLKAKNYMIILFTRKEDLDGEALEDFIADWDVDLKEQVYRCGNRFLAFNNKAEGTEHEAQVGQLMAMIDALVQKNCATPCYTEEMFKDDKEQFRKNSKFSWRCPVLSGSERRIILVGKTGVGKSATANTILGRPVFESKMSSVSVTQACQREEALLNGRKVVVVDTPGFFHTKHPKQETSDEVRKCVKFCTPGPHVILQVIRPVWFTQEEKEVAGLIKEIFTQKAKDYMIILFTRKEDLDGKAVETFITENADLKEEVYRCGNRFLAFNNKAEGAEREAQVGQLMAMIDALVQKNHAEPYYTEKMFKDDMEHFGKKSDSFRWCFVL